MANRLTTVFPRQGHYALDRENLIAYPAADLTVERIGDLVDYDLDAVIVKTNQPASGVRDRSGT